MTQQKSLKKRVRARMAKTGERYTAARRNLVDVQPGSTRGGDAASTDDATIDTPARADTHAELAAAAASVVDSPFRGGHGASDQALVQRTGHDWAHWYRLLDEWGAANRKHPEIARWLRDAQGVDGWWSQELTVRYEMAIGRRVPGQRADGFEVSISKTMRVPVERLREAVTEESERARWLVGDTLHSRRTASATTARFDWTDGSRVVVAYTPKGEDRSLLSVAVQKLPDEAAMERARERWRSHLHDLGAYLEG